MICGLKWIVGGLWLCLWGFGMGLLARNGFCRNSVKRWLVLGDVLQYYCALGPCFSP